VTLVLLCSISAIIVGRSYLLRRRFRRRVEEALRNGQVLSPDDPGIIGLSSSVTTKLLGPPPKLWDVWIEPPMVTNATLEAEFEKSGKFPWTELRPLSAEIVPQNPRRLRKPPFTDRRISSNDSSVWVPKPWMRRRTPQSSSSSVPTLSSPLVESSPEKDPHIRIVTLIAMPTPRPMRPNPPSRVASNSSWSLKGKWKEDKLDLSPITVAVTELKVVLEEVEEETKSNESSSSNKDS